MPEVERVFGKAGRADTATDPAPLEMFETTIQFKPREQWRAGMTPDKLVEELDRAVKVPGSSNIWVPPIRNRIDMLATGIKSPVGIKVAGADLATIDRLATQIEAAVKERSWRVLGAGRAADRRPLHRRRRRPRWPQRATACRWPTCRLSSPTAIGGDNVGEVDPGPRALSRSTCATRARSATRCERLRQLPFVTDKGATVLLQDVARVSIDEGPPMLRSENARLSGWVYVDVRGRDLRSVVHDMQAGGGQAGRRCRPGYAVSWSGQFEYLERATERLKLVVPVDAGRHLRACCTCCSARSATRRW